MDDVGLWPLGPEDLPELQRLVELQARNVSEQEYARFLELEGAGGFVLRSKEGFQAAITVMRHFEHAVLGPIVAQPTLPSSLGLALFTHAMEAILRTGATRVEMAAAPEEALALQSLGFERVGETLVLERPAGARTTERVGLRALEEKDVLDVGALDALAVGYGRKEYLTQLAQAFPEGAIVQENAEGEIIGFTFLRKAKRGYHLGPVVTATHDIEAALDLARTAISRVSTWPVVTLVAKDSPFAEGLVKEGFTPVGHLVRLRAGDTPEAPQATHWALGGRLTG